MDTILLLARLILATVFVVAGVAKLVDLVGSRRALEGFGVPARLAVPGAILLPIAEVLVAVLLLPRATAWWGGLGGLLLLLLFIAGIGYNLSQGRTPDCHCFGQIHSEPAGWSTLARNGLLAAVAAVIVATGWGDPGPSLVAWVDDMSTGETVALVLAAVAFTGLAIEGWVLAHLLGQNGRVLLRLDDIEAKLAATDGTAPARAAAAPPAQAGLAEGMPAPAFRLDGLHGETVTLDSLCAVGKPLLLLFSDPTCGPCNALLPDIGRWQRDHTSRLTIAMISRGTVEANKVKTSEHGITNVLVQHDREIAQAYQAHGTPSAVLVNPEGTIGSPLAAGAEAIRALLSKATSLVVPSHPINEGPRPASVASTRTPQNGAVASALPTAPDSRPLAPAIELPDLSGKITRLQDFVGSPTLVLFWNPGCGFCQRMLLDLKQWETDPSVGSPTLLVVSTGSVEENEAQGFRSSVVLDQGFATGNAYGVSGTPSAVLIDEQGQIASAVAVGAPAVLALARGDDPATAMQDEAIPEERPQPPAIGEPAPAFELSTLDGHSIELNEFRGRKTLVLFWNPGCSYCGEMMDQLREWELAPPADAPNLIVVSSGSPESHASVDLHSPVVIDEHFATGWAYGASGTPSAILVDADGRVASNLAVGAKGVLDLAGYISPRCVTCVDDCKERGGGSACRSVCEMGGQCP